MLGVDNGNTDPCRDAIAEYAWRQQVGNDDRDKQ